VRDEQGARISIEECACESGQWFTVGRDYDFHDGEWKMIGGAANADSILVASEPLTVDTSTWLEVPEYSALCATLDDGKLTMRTVELTA